MQLAWNGLKEGTEQNLRVHFFEPFRSGCSTSHAPADTLAW